MTDVTGESTILAHETFEDGLAVHGPDPGWFHVEMGAYVTANADVGPIAGRGLSIVSRAFSNTLPQEADGGIPATNDHAKWLAYFSRRSSAGFPGFDAVAGRELAGAARLTGRTFFTERHPFGDAVADPHGDLRLAAFAMTTIDLETFMVFDFFFTNRQVYAFYERLPFARTPEHDYAAFSYAIPVKTRREDDLHDATIAYDRSAGVVRWLLDGVEVFQVNRIGHRLPGRAALIDLGGEEETVAPRQLDFGMGLFTLLDGALGTGPGLVRLSDRLAYRSPVDPSRPLTFVDEHSDGRNRLFGQGAEMTIGSYTVREQPAHPRLRHVPGGEGPSVVAAGDLYTFKATAGDTAGRMTMWEAVVPPGGGPPPHVHVQQDEAYYVLDGEVDVFDGTRSFTARAGDFVFIPRGSVHRFANTGSRESRLLIWMTPAGFEEFLFRVGRAAGAGDGPSPPAPDEIARTIALAADYGLEIVAP